MRPIFFFGTLRDVALLEIVIGRKIRAGEVEPADAPDAMAWQVADEAYPMLRAVAGARAEGVLFTPGAADEIEALSFYEEAEYALLPIEVDTANGPRKARYFGATAKLQPGDAPWSFEEWRAEGRAIALEAAAELMPLRSTVPVERVDDYWPAIMKRARQRATAAATPAVLGTIRRAFGPDDVTWNAHVRPYQGFLAVEEHRLRHRTHNGGWSPTLERVTVAWGDAVSVLPYDPATDQVLLIEQFRVGVAARRDPNAWCIEVPAGGIDPEEVNAESTVRREVLEETGITLGRLWRLPGYYPSPGMISEHMGAWIGEADLATAEAGLYGKPGEGEDIRTMILPLDEALAALREGAVNTGPAQILLLWCALERVRLRAEWAQGAASI
ncbi:MAG: NUDIX domain-containing protein [Pseudomonadota bacterium]